MGYGLFDGEDRRQLWLIELPTTIEETVIPEPSTGLLLGFGTAMLAWRRRGPAGPGASRSRGAPSGCD